MRHNHPRHLHCVTLLLVFIVTKDTTAEDTNWPGFHGPDRRGVATGYRTAESWDATAPKDQTIRWRTSVPGLGHSSPVIFGNRLFLTTAVSEAGEAPLQVGRGGNTAAADDDGTQTWLVLCYNKTTGEELWRSVARRGTPRTTRHTKATHANSTVAVDGKHVVAFFGSEGVHCYDHDGMLLWKRDLGVINISKYGIGWGYASSPAIHGNQLVLVCDDPDDPHVVALELSSGDQLWRTSRDGDCERSWGTPLIHQTPDATQVVVNGWPWIVSYDLKSGKERWRIAGGGDNPVPTPFAVDNCIYLTNSHGGKSPIYAIRADASGNLSDESITENRNAVVWKTERGGSYMSTPVVWGDYLYLANTNGTVRCFHALTGELVYERRLGRGASFTASLVAADDKIYCPSEDGTIFVLRAGSEFEVLARNRMGEPCFATPAISGGTLFIRTSRSLVAIRPDETGDSNVRIEPGKRPNILFIAVDDLRPSIGCYGDRFAKTPNIDGLSQRGIQFDRAYCQVAVCNPSRASLMTGLKPDNLGVWTLPIHFREARPDAVTIPQWFRKFGYTAVSHGKIYHNPTPDPQSWSEAIRPLPSLPFPYPEGTKERVKAAMRDLPAGDWRKNNLRNPSTAAPEFDDSRVLDGARTDMAIEDLRRLGAGSAPFFLAMGYIRPHLAWIAPKKYWDMHDAGRLPVLTNQKVNADTPAYALSNNSELSHYVDLIDFPKPWDSRTISVEQARHLMHGYYACVSYVDAQIGRLLNALKEAGLAKNTIVVLWSDHGWKLGEYRGWGKMSNYEIDARVPLIIAGPGVKSPGRNSEQLVELLDLYPTLCDMVAIRKPDFLDGTSLISTLKNERPESRTTAVSQYYRKLNGEEYMGYSLRTRTHRFVEWRSFRTGEVETRELYDHQIDSDETLNIAGTESKELIQQLADQLAATHPRKELSMTPAVHSSPGTGRWPAKISFLNQHGSEIKVFPITPLGRRGRAKTVSTGQKVTYNARIGGVYVVESVDGKVHEIHSPSIPDRTVTID